MAQIELIASRSVSLAPVISAQIELIASRSVSLTPLPEPSIRFLDSRVINLPSPVGGIITKVEFEWNGSQNIAPVYSVPIGKKGLVHVWGRNDTQFTQELGISWVVTDPGRIIVEQYQEWEAWPHPDPGEIKEFIGDRFYLGKTGNYTITIGLFMNPSNPFQIDSYSGLLCVVGKEIPPPPPDGELPPPPPNGKPPEKEFPWLPAALIGGGIIIVAATGKKPKA